MRPFRFDEPIATERLLLRLPTVADVDAVLAYQGREDVCRYQEYGPRDRADVAAWAAGNGAAVRLESEGDHLQPVIWFKGGWGDTGVYAMLENEWAGERRDVVDEPSRR